jgi:hypothetical protein
MNHDATRTDGHNGPSRENETNAARNYRNLIADRTGIGQISGSEGIGSPDQPTYVPTRHELLELARYWLTERYFVETLAFWGEPVDRQDGGKWNLAIGRLDRIAAVLDEDGIREVRCGVEEDFRRRMGEKAWNIFMNGSKAEQHEFVANVLAGAEDKVGPPEFAAEIAEMAIHAFPCLKGGGLVQSLRAAAAYAETHGLSDDIEAAYDLLKDPSQLNATTAKENRHEES